MQGTARQGNAGCRSLVVGVFHELFSIRRDPLDFLDTMPMRKSRVWNYAGKTSTLQAVCVIALITGYMASLVNEWLLWRCEVVQPSSCFPGTWLSVIGLCGHLMLQSVGPTGEQSPSQCKRLLAGEELCEEVCQLLYRDMSLWMKSLAFALCFPWQPLHFVGTATRYL